MKSATEWYLKERQSQEFAEFSRQFMEASDPRQVDYMSRLVKLRMTGPKTRDDLQFLYLVDSGKLNLGQQEPWRNIGTFRPITSDYEVAKNNAINRLIPVAVREPTREELEAQERRRQEEREREAIEKAKREKTYRMQLEVPEVKFFERILLIDGDLNCHPIYVDLEITVDYFKELLSSQYNIGPMEYDYLCIKEDVVWYEDEEMPKNENLLDVEKDVYKLSDFGIGKNDKVFIKKKLIK